jgi:transposase
MTAIIGIDPHKTTHMAVAIDGDEQAIARLEVRADRAQTQRLLAWAARLGAERSWAIESAGGLGKLLSQELVAEGECVVDVPPTLAARVRLLGSQKAAKNDGNDALSTAIAGLASLWAAGGAQRRSLKRVSVAGWPLRRPDRVADTGRVQAACGVAGARRRRRTPPIVGRSGGETAPRCPSRRRGRG